MKTEKFILRTICILLILTILLINHNQYERIKKCESDITCIQEVLYMDWEIERLEKKLLSPPIKSTKENGIKQTVLDRCYVELRKK